MIIVRLQGGLGNQMFQYALGRHLAIKNDTPLKLDTTMLEGRDSAITKRDYSLSVFNIEESFATEKEIAWFKKYQFKKGKSWFWYNRLVTDRKTYAWEEKAYFEPWILTLKDPVYLDGWWQTERYFIDIRDTLRKDFTLKDDLGSESKKILSQISGTEAVALHIRRGDYISDPRTNAWIGTCSNEYYSQAIRKIAATVKNPHFFIFSDDPDWAKEHITPPFPTTYVPRNATRPEEDIYLMSRCKHNIVANSSFSWWGAWLNDNSHKLVIAPKRWFLAPKMARTEIVPDTWATIENA
jgi:hypothetical protein